jgi:hypothetical protein
MAQRKFGVRDHEYIINAVPLAEGGWTLSIVHICYARSPPTESRTDSNLAHPTEEEALDQGELIALEMARRYAG